MSWLSVEASHRLDTMKEAKHIHTSYLGDYCFVIKERGIYKYDECGMIWYLSSKTAIVNGPSIKELKKGLHVINRWEKPTAAQLHHHFCFLLPKPSQDSHWHRVVSIKDLSICQNELSLPAMLDHEHEFAGLTQDGSRICGIDPRWITNAVVRGIDPRWITTWRD